MVTYELKIKMIQNHSNGYSAKKDGHFSGTSFLSLFKKMDKILNEHDSSWFIQVWFYKIDNLHYYKIKDDTIFVENEDDRTLLSYFTTSGQAPFDA